MRIAGIVTTLVAALLALSACGYKAGSPPSDWAGGTHKLAIPMFANQSPYVDAQAVFTQKAREVFAREGGFALVGEDRAELILRGTVLRIEQPPATRRFADGGPQVASYDLAATVKLELVDITGQIQWEQTFTERSDLFGGRRSATQRYNRNDVLQRLARQLLERAYRQLGESF